MGKIEKAANISSELQEGTYTPQHKITYTHGFIDGAKWQEKRSSSKKNIAPLLKFINDCQCGNLVSKEYDPCCSVECWYVMFV